MIDMLNKTYHYEERGYEKRVKVENTIQEVETIVEEIKSCKERK